jgi:serine/threonine-protein kinase HipA
MARPRITADLHLFMNGQRVGCLTRTAVGQLRLEYHDEWLQSEMGRPLSLSMPLSQRVYIGDVVENFFENLLPDSQPIRSRIQARFSAKSNRCFDLLWHVGRDCVGALQLLPEDAASIDVHNINAVELSESQIAEILRNYATMPLGMKGDDDFRISIAGAQEKTALLRLNNRWHRPLGVTPTSHIFKLPIGRIIHSGMDLTDSVENEWLCLRILKAYGIPVAEAETAFFEDVKVLVVQRFDRRWADDRSWLIRLPQEDMCQALNIPPALKYESDGGPGMERIMTLLLGSANALADRHLFLRTQVLFWLLGAIDGHAKNFSIVLLPGGSYQLAPIYDVMSAYPLLAKRQIEPQKMRMAMAVRGKSSHYRWDKILHRHWLSTAQSCRFPIDEMETIIKDLLEKMDMVIEQVAGELPASFPGKVAQSIFDGMKGVRNRLSHSS